MFTIAGGPATGEAEYSGRISAGREVELAFEVPGLITDLPVTEGQKLKARQLVARIDDRSQRAQYDLAIARTRLARQEADRARKLFESAAVSQQDLERAQAQLKVEEANLRVAQKLLDDTVIRAPFDSIVARKLVNDFRRVNPREPIVLLQDPSTLEVKVDVPESDLSVSMPALSLEERNRRARIEVELSSRPGQRLRAQISEFATAADPKTRTFQVTLVLDRPEDFRALPGMTVRVIASAQGLLADGITIPAHAVRSNPNRESVVWLLEKNGAEWVAKERKVKLGEMTRDQVQVISGLVPGERIAQTGVHHLQEGMRVTEMAPPRGSGAEPRILRGLAVTPSEGGAPAAPPKSPTSSPSQD